MRYRIKHLDDKRHLPQMKKSLFGSWKTLKRAPHGVWEYPENNTEHALPTASDAEDVIYDHIHMKTQAWAEMTPLSFFVERVLGI